MKILKCISCGADMIITKKYDKSYTMECSCGVTVSTPVNNPLLKEVPDNYPIKICDKEDILKNALLQIRDIACDYDGCNTIKSLKDLIDELVGISDDAIRRYYARKENTDKNDLFPLWTCANILLKNMIVNNFNLYIRLTKNNTVEVGLLKLEEVLMLIPFKDRKTFLNIYNKFLEDFSEEINLEGIKEKYLYKDFYNSIDDIKIELVNKIIKSKYKSIDDLKHIFLVQYLHVN